MATFNSTLLTLTSNANDAYNPTTGIGSTSLTNTLINQTRTTTFTFLNSSSDTIKLDHFSVASNVEFGLLNTGTCQQGNTLNSGDSCTMIVQFNPLVPSQYSDALVIEYTKSQSTFIQTQTLNATGVN